MKIIGDEAQGCGFIADIDAKKEIRKIKEFLLKQYNVKNIYTLKQIHSDIILLDSSGTGDGIIITEAGNAGIVCTADCFPVVLVDKKKQVSGIFHSGWKSTELDIVGKGVIKMKKLGCRDICASVFPAIGACCFEIGEEIVERFDRAKIPVHEKEGKIFADLKTAIVNSLKRKNVEMIKDFYQCTYCDDTLFSYRRDKTAKRHASFIVNIS